MKKRLYISIPITGMEEKSKIKAEQMQKHFEAQGYEVINPFEIGIHIEELHKLCGMIHPTWHNYMDWCLKAICFADIIYFCKGWEKSEGCKLEMQVSKNKEIRYE